LKFFSLNVTHNITYLHVSGLSFPKSDSVALCSVFIYEPFFIFGLLYSVIS